MKFMVKNKLSFLDVAAYYDDLSSSGFDILKEDSVTLAAIINMVILSIVFIDLMSLDHSPLLRKDKKKVLTKNNLKKEENLKTLFKEIKQELPHVVWQTLDKKYLIRWKS